MKTFFKWKQKFKTDANLRENPPQQMPGGVQVKAGTHSDTLNAKHTQTFGTISLRRNSDKVCVARTALETCSLTLKFGRVRGSARCNVRCTVTAQEALNLRRIVLEAHTQIDWTDSNADDRSNIVWRFANSSLNSEFKSVTVPACTVRAGMPFSRGTGRESRTLESMPPLPASTESSKEGERGPTNWPTTGALETIHTTALYSVNA